VTRVVDFISIFQSVAPAKKADTISACRLPGNPPIWVGKDVAGMPVLVVQPGYGPELPPAIVLRNMRFDPRIECSIQEGLATRLVLDASLIRLTAEDVALHNYFLRAVAALLSTLTDAPTVQELSSAISKLAEIFRALSLPATSTLQGLWAELLVVCNARDVHLAAQAWHPTRRSLFDFDVGNEAVDVKSSITGIRKHHFKLAQLQPPSSKRIVVMSLLLTPSSSASSINDLWERIQSRLSERPELVSRLAQVIANAVGTDWRHAHATQFDEASALSSLAVYAATEIPQPQDPDNPNVTDVEFSSDLSSLSTSPLPAIAAGNKLLTALLPIGS